MVTVPLPLASATALACDGPAPRSHENAKGTRDPQKSARSTAHDASARRRPEREHPPAPVQDGSLEPGAAAAAISGRPRQGTRSIAQEHAIAHGDGSMRRLSGFCDGVTDACGMVRHRTPLEPRRTRDDRKTKGTRDPHKSSWFRLRAATGEPGRAPGQPPAPTIWRLLQAHAVGVVGDGRRPVGEDAEDADLLRQHVQHLKHVAVVVDRVGDRSGSSSRRRRPAARSARASR